MEYISDQERQFGISQEPYGLATNEVTQAAETGHDVTALRARLDGLRSDGGDNAELLAIYADTPRTPAADWPYTEVSELEDIRALLEPSSPAVVPTGPDLAERVRGAWFGRVVGNMLGKPVEFGFSRPMLRAYLEKHGAYPLDDYIPINLERRVQDGFMMDDLLPYDRLARGRIYGGVRDDDVDYTILGLHLLETYGRGLTTYDIAREWLTRLPAYQTYTAERATYQNLIREIPLDQVGEFQNPFREWIGALIRADIFGFAHPGDPRTAAEFAHRDAVLSHRANGIYGEMWAAALVATAFTADSAEASVQESLLHIPATSRLAEEIGRVRADYLSGLTWEQAAASIDARYERMSWVHTLNNAGALTAAVLWGEGDFTRTIALAVQAGLDTDSIGATAGAWAGAFAGYSGIPTHWLDPLHGRTVSAVFGYGEIDLDRMTARTLAVIEALR